MAKKAPWFPVYPADWLTDQRIEIITNEGLGAYLRLLCYEWINDGLPDNPEDLAILSQAHERWPEIAEQVLPFFSKRKTGELYHKGLEEVRLKRAARRARR